MQTITFAVHTAHLDPMTGSGLLVMPHAEDDLILSGRTLHESAWSHVMANLDRLGWEPSYDDGLPMLHGTTGDGREVYALVGYDSIISESSLAEIGEAFRALEVECGCDARCPESHGT